MECASKGNHGVSAENHPGETGSYSLIQDRTKDAIKAENDNGEEHSA